MEDKMKAKNDKKEEDEKKEDKKSWKEAQVKGVHGEGGVRREQEEEGKG